MKIVQNVDRIKHLLSLYRMTVEELLASISHGLKKPLSKEDVFTEQIGINTLKRIDKVFSKGLNYYLDPKSPENSSDVSIFFRKSTFGIELNIGAKKVVNHFEELKISLSAVSKLSDIHLERTLPVYTIKSDPLIGALELRNKLYPEFHTSPKEFLKNLIFKFADYNILVFEFVETWNKREKANIDGFFLHPNVIVLKRQQNSFRREIFTLAHELAHFLLDKEEIEALDVLNLANKNLSAIERWCNDFAYHFLAGDLNDKMESIQQADPSNDYHHDLIKAISGSTHLSVIALYTRLLYRNKVSQKNYNKIKTNLDEQFRQKLELEKKRRELDKLQGIEQRGSAPKPITSPLLIATLKTAFYEGIINEYDFCKSLDITPNKFGFYFK